MALAPAPAPALRVVELTIQIGQSVSEGAFYLA